ncbi:hypothetical protein EVAR_93411_1 [Eumeta japonica]|uniref:Uncharacterized protein n=1 Tax=Eumeta variegata TaxID=151549 RepID=A0A4C1URK4_EUMVA|nr:hypothetical protein EVAR_93411_1 [Eumeta japonica]
MGLIFGLPPPHKSDVIFGSIPIALMRGFDSATTVFRLLVGCYRSIIDDPYHLLIPAHLVECCRAVDILLEKLHELVEGWRYTRSVLVNRENGPLLQPENSMNICSISSEQDAIRHQAIIQPYLN